MKLLTIIGVVGLIVLSGCASQDDVLTLDYRLSLLEQRNRELEKRNAELKKQNTQAIERNANLKSQMDNVGKSLGAEDQKTRMQYAQMSVLVRTYGEELQTLRGKIEENEYFLNRHLQATKNQDQNLNTELAILRKEMEALNRRLDYLEQYLNVEPYKAKTQSPEAVGKAAAKQPQAQTLYQSAKQAFDQGDFNTARENFEKIIAQFPKSEHADNAQFWIGEIYYREKWYEKAILEYQKVVEKYPKGNKVPASLLKQGFSFLNLGDKANARLILKELVKKYPDSNEGKIARQKLEELQ
jgi:tol-pal system protein YbgF